MLAMSARGLVNSWALKQRQCIYILRVYYRAAVDKVISLQMLHLHQRSIPSKTEYHVPFTGKYWPRHTYQHLRRSSDWLENLAEQQNEERREFLGTPMRLVEFVMWTQVFQLHKIFRFPFFYCLWLGSLIISLFTLRQVKNTKVGFFAYMGLLCQYLFQGLLYYLKKCAEKWKLACVNSVFIMLFAGLCKKLLSRWSWS